MGTNRSGKNLYARIRRAKKNMETRERAQQTPTKKPVAAKSTGKASGTLAKQKTAKK